MASRGSRWTSRARQGIGHPGNVVADERDSSLSDPGQLSRVPAAPRPPAASQSWAGNDAGVRTTRYGGEIDLNKLPAAVPRERAQGRRGPSPRCAKRPAGTHAGRRLGRLPPPGRRRMMNLQRTRPGHGQSVTVSMRDGLPVLRPQPKPTHPARLPDDEPPLAATAAWARSPGRLGPRRIAAQTGVAAWERQGRQASVRCGRHGSAIRSISAGVGHLVQTGRRP